MVSEKPYENENREKKYIEGQVKVGNGGGITGVFDLPEWAAMCKLHGDIVFMGYHNTRLPEKYRREHMKYFKKAAEELMELRRSGHLPTIEPEIPSPKFERIHIGSHPIFPYFLIDLLLRNLIKFY